MMTPGLRTAFRVLPAASLIAAFVVGAAVADCPDEWYPIFGVPPGTNGIARAATLWDPDGDGPLPGQPVVAGEFGMAGGIHVNRIARFDGVMWLPFGSGASTGLSGTVRALTTWDADGDGPQPPRLIAGGDFNSAGGVTVNKIAQWNGSAWQALGSGFSGTRVSAVVSWDADGDGPQPPRLVAGGIFASTTDGTTVNHVAIWDGATWQPRGDGFASGVTSALTTYDPDGDGPLTPQLIAGGSWTMSGTTVVNRVARWDGGAWQPLGSGFNQGVSGLTAWDTDGSGPQGEQIVAVGDFNLSGGTPLMIIARWDGAAWQPLGSGIGGTTTCVTTWDPDGDGPVNPEVVAAGSFTLAGGNSIQRVARWNGTTWQGFGTGIPTASVHALTVWDADGTGPDVAAPVVVGQFTSAGSHAVFNTAVWRNGDWRPLGNGLGGVTAGQVTSLATWDADGPGGETANVVAAGSFTVASGKTVNRIARFDGSAWHGLATGLSGTVWGLSTWDPDGGGPLHDHVIAVGDFTLAGSTVVNQVARWDGSQWHAFGGGIGAKVAAVTVWDIDGAGGLPGVVVVGGNFTEAAGKPGNYVAMWDGDSWEPMSSGFSNEVFSLVTFSPNGNPADARVFAGGSFGVGASPPPNLIAQWTGSAWEGVGQGVDSHVYAMTADPQGAGPLVAGGAFNLAINATIANRVAAWSGADWIDLAFEPGLSADTAGVVYGLTTWDADGAGPMDREVIAGGSFTRTVAGPVPELNRIARWDGDSWEPLGAGTNGLVLAVMAWDPDGPGPQSEVLVAGGNFGTAGGLPGGLISAAGGCAAPCQPCDANCDGIVSSLDAAAFVELLLANTSPCSSCAGDPSGDTLLNGDDIAELMSQLLP